MKRIACLAAVLAVTISSYAQSDREAQGWQLVWQDEFDSINQAIWVVENHFDHWGGELQVYTNRPENVFIEDGSLVLRANREAYSCPPESVNPWRCARQYQTGLPYEYTSGYIETRPEYNTQYGLIEARVWLPYGYGFWPAFWTFRGGGVSTQNANEIDIFEMLGHKPPNKITTNVHLDYCNPDYEFWPDCSAIPSYYQENLIANYTYSWHTYAIDWSPTHLRWWYDDYMFRIMPNPGVVDPVRTILNFAIEQGHPPNAQTPFPSDMRIDYVRVYQYVVGTEQHQLDPDLVSVYPNPATAGKALTVTLPAGVMLRGLTLTDALGRAVASAENAGYGLPLPDLVAGCYYLHIETGAGRAVKTIIVR